MAQRSKAPIRRERESDTMEALKPLVVLGLLGTILYGAYSVVQKGPGNAAAGWQPPAASTSASSAGDAPPFVAAAPTVDIPQAGPAPTGPTSTPPIADLPAAQAAAFPPPAPTAPPAPAALAPAMDAAIPPQMPSVPPAAGMPPAIAAAPPAPPAATLPDQPPTFLTAQAASPPVPESPPPAPAAMLPEPAAAAADPSAALPPAAFAAGGAAPTGSAAFATAWSEAHDMLAGGRYAEALAALSVWHDDPSLSVEESQRLEDLLGQLAGTVIYSQQDLLLPPHIVAPGETLQSITMPLSVPWQLVAKINGIDDPAKLVPGEHLKMVRGPFDAVVSVSRRRLSLQVGGNYAGTFPVVIGRQIQDRVGSSLAVVDIRRGDAPSPSSVPSGPAAQVSFVSPSTAKSIVLGDGLSIEAADDPAVVADSAPQTSLVVSARDLEELVDILGPGSQVLIRQ